MGSKGTTNLQQMHQNAPTMHNRRTRNAQINAQHILRKPHISKCTSYTTKHNKCIAMQ